MHLAKSLWLIILGGHIGLGKPVTSPSRNPSLTASSTRSGSSSGTPSSPLSSSSSGTSSSISIPSPSATPIPGVPGDITWHDVSTWKNLSDIPKGWPCFPDSSTRACNQCGGDSNKNGFCDDALPYFPNKTCLENYKPNNKLINDCDAYCACESDGGVVPAIIAPFIAAGFPVPAMIIGTMVAEELSRCLEGVENRQCSECNGVGSFCTTGLEVNCPCREDCPADSDENVPTCEAKACKGSEESDWKCTIGPHVTCGCKTSCPDKDSAPLCADDKCNGNDKQKCTTGEHEGCSCQACPEEDKAPLCTDDNCKGDGKEECTGDDCNENDKEKCTAGDHKGCPCRKCPKAAKLPLCTDDKCEATDPNIPRCTKEEYKGCECLVMLGQPGVGAVYLPPIAIDNIWEYVEQHAVPQRPWCALGASPHGDRLPEKYCQCGDDHATTYSIAPSPTKTKAGQTYDPCPYTKPPGPTVTFTDKQPYCLYGASPHSNKTPKKYCQCGVDYATTYSVLPSSTSVKSFDPCPYTAPPGPTLTFEEEKPWCIPGADPNGDKLPEEYCRCGDNYASTYSALPSPTSDSSRKRGFDPCPYKKAPGPTINFILKPEDPKCEDLDTKHWMDRDVLEKNINDFCGEMGWRIDNPKATGEHKAEYNEDTRNHVQLSVKWPLHSKFKPTIDNCLRDMGRIMDGCQWDADNNPLNWKHGGSLVDNSVIWTVKPLKDRYVPGKCSMHIKFIDDWFWNQNGPIKSYYYVELEAKDGKGDTLENFDDRVPIKEGTPNALKKVYYNTMLVHLLDGNGLLRFEIGDQSWESDQENGRTRCNMGAWSDVADDPRTKDMDCFFDC